MIEENDCDLEQTVEESTPKPRYQDEDGLVSLYYANFHPSHPFLVPKQMYWETAYPPYLRHIVQFVGSHYSFLHTAEENRTVALEALSSNRNVRHYHLVQARLLAAIVLHARSEIMLADELLSEAVTLALELGMHNKEFATANGDQFTVYEESLRRTWWDLYVVDGFMAALQRRPSFRCHNVEPCTLLPCSEVFYAKGVNMPEPASLAEFDLRIYNSRPWSSFCYRIDAVRILARVLPIAWIPDARDSHIQAIDNAIAAWPHHVSLSQEYIDDTTEESDELFFQARMLLYYALIYLHFPRSNLVATIPATGEIIRQSLHLPSSAPRRHTVKAIEGAQNVGNLAAMPAAVQKHCPFFTCGIVFSIIVQLSACGRGMDDQYRDQIHLILGLLKTLGQTWALSQICAQKMKRIAYEVLESANEIGTQSRESRDSMNYTEHIFSERQLEDLDWIDFFRWDALT